MEKKVENEMETGVYIGIIRVYSPLEVDSIWLWVYYTKIPKYTFILST